MDHPQPMNVYRDSRSALHFPNPVVYECTKHIEIDYHYVLHAVQDGLIAPHRVTTTKQLADLFTKLSGKQHFFCNYLASWKLYPRPQCTVAIEFT